MKLTDPFGMSTNSSATDLGIALLRIGLGFFMIYGHGWGKLMKLFGDEPIKFMDFMGLGETTSLALVVFAEFLCSFFLIFGLATRWVLVPLIVTMVVAVFIAHGDDQFGKKEKGLLYLIPYITLFLSGAGRYSLDALFGKNNGRRE